MTIGIIFRANGPQVLHLSTKSSRPFFAPGYPGCPRVPPVTRGNDVRNRCSDPTSTRTGGQDDVS